jgi:aspartate kinase
MIVLKFGGTSVANIERIHNVADIIAQAVREEQRVIVAVSAMSGVTNELVAMMRGIYPIPCHEYDSVVSTGEQVTSGILASILCHKHGIKSRSWLGWQIAINTSNIAGKAIIRTIDTEKINLAMDQGGDKVAVVAGFQGVDSRSRITTIGRGGSDTVAVALAAAFQAKRCDIYTDVDGIYTADPRIVSHARRIDRIAFEEMLELASLGAKVLQTRSVKLAMKENVRLRVLSTFNPNIGGTLVVEEQHILERQRVTGIAHSTDEAKITLRQVPDKPGVSAEIFKPLTDNHINVDMIVQNISEDQNYTDITFTISRQDLSQTKAILSKAKEYLGYKSMDIKDNVAKVSVVGLGMKAYVGVAQTMFETLASNNINIDVISTSEIKISVLIDEDYTEVALRSLHKAYGLDA